LGDSNPQNKRAANYNSSGKTKGKEQKKKKIVIKPTKQQLEQRMGQKKTGKGASGSSSKTSRRRV
jgi:3-phenylpropionate/cinnamic acid dioxygenase small subunit